MRTIIVRNLQRMETDKNGKKIWIGITTMTFDAKYGKSV
jgi:hypothetical protein